MLNKKTFHYFILFLLMAQSSMPFFVGNIYLGLGLFVSAIAFMFRKEKIDTFILRFIIVFFALMIMHVLLFNKFNMGTILGFLSKIIFAYFTLKIVGKNFIPYFIRLMYWLTLISLFFWVLLSFTPGAYDFFETISRNFVQPLEAFDSHVRNNLIIYTNDYWLKDVPPRNAGPFWEPGGFGVFLVLALLLNTLQSPHNILNKYNIVFIIALITTFSLGTFFCFFLFVISYILLVRRLNIYSIIVTIVIITTGLISYNSLDFLGEKLAKRELAVMYKLDRNATYSTINRTVGRNEKARLDIKEFLESPLVGKGMFNDYEYASSSSGITNFLSKWGIIGFLFFFGTMLHSFNKYLKSENRNNRLKYVALLTMLSISLSQGVYGKSFFIGMCFVFLIKNTIPVMTKPRISFT